MNAKFTPCNLKGKTDAPPSKSMAHRYLIGAVLSGKICELKGIDYSEVRGLRLEAAQKLNKIRPLTIGQAARISGVNPADVSVLLIYLGIK